MMARHNGDLSDYSRFSLDIERGDESEESVPLSNRIRPGSRATSSRASSGMSAMRPRHVTQFNSLSQHVNTSGGIQIIPDGFDDEDVWLVTNVVLQS